MTKLPKTREAESAELGAPSKGRSLSSDAETTRHHPQFFGRVTTIRNRSDLILPWQYKSLPVSSVTLSVPQASLRLHAGAPVSALQSALKEACIVPGDGRDELSSSLEA
eukprot:6347845-Amphidinium_carterae.1